MRGKISVRNNSDSGRTKEDKSVFVYILQCLYLFNVDDIHVVFISRSFSYISAHSTTFVDRIYFIFTENV